MLIKIFFRLLKNCHARAGWHLVKIKLVPSIIEKNLKLFFWMPACAGMTKRRITLRVISSLQYSTVLLLALSAQGCFSPVSLPEIHRYQLTTNPAACNSTSRTARTLFISLPHATAPYNTTQMVYSQIPNEICWFAENRWVTPLPQMTLPLMIQSICSTHHFKGVVGFPTIANTDYRLETSLITFKQEFCGPKSCVHIILDTALILAKTQKIIATRRIEVIVPTSCKTPQAGVAAYQCAFNKVLRQLNEFIINHSV